MSMCGWLAVRIVGLATLPIRMIGAVLLFLQTWWRLRDLLLVHPQGPKDDSPLEIPLLYPAPPVPWSPRYKVSDVVCPACDAGVGVLCVQTGRLVAFVEGGPYHMERWKAVEAAQADTDR